MSTQNDSILKKVSPAKIALPMLIGLAVVSYMMYKEFDAETFSLIGFSWLTLFFLVISILMMAVRDIGYMIRLRILTSGEISWKNIFNIIMLWEFTSAITPSAIGGTSVAVYFIHKEGLTVGKSTAVVMATSFLDELYFIIMFPLVFLLVSGAELFSIGGVDVLGKIDFTNKYFYFAIIGYSFKFGFTALISYGLFFNPESIKKILNLIFKLPIIRKWKKGADKTGNDIVLASTELKSKPFKFWLKAFIATFFSWSARYWVVNFLLLALIFGIPSSVNEYLISFSEHFLIFARQLVMWIMLLVMPTPGGSGFAEAIFSEYMAEFIPVGFVVLMAFLWRIVTYYPYLIIGVVVVPKWIKKVLSRKD